MVYSETSPIISTHKQQFSPTSPLLTQRGSAYKVVDGNTSREIAKDAVCVNDYNFLELFTGSRDLNDFKKIKENVSDLKSVGIILFIILLCILIWQISTLSGSFKSFGLIASSVALGVAFVHLFSPSGVMDTIEDSLFIFGAIMVGFSISNLIPNQATQPTQP